jgi:lysyl-tRNA synthetase class 2
MKPEKKIPQSSNEEWAAIGVAEEWVPVLRKAGFNMVSNIKDEKAQGLQQKIGDIVKKFKLEMTKPSVDDIQQWIEKANA